VEEVAGKRGPQWQQEMQRVVGNDAMLVNALELESTNDSANFTLTCIEELLVGPMESQGWPSRLGVMAWVMVGVGAFAIISVLVSFARSFFISGKFNHSSFVLFSWLSWVSLALFLSASTAEVTLFNRSWSAFGEFLQKLRTTVTSPEATRVAAGLNAISHLQQSKRVSEIQTLLQLKDMQYLTQDAPIMCGKAFLEGDDTYNGYPTGSYMHAFNMRRIIDRKTDESPEMDMAKSLLLSDPYPPLAGGVTTEQAKLFGAVSNACERFHRSVADCCDSNLSSPIPLKDRCPGKALKAYDRDHCMCMEGTIQLGIDVENQQVVLCLLQIRDWTMQWLEAAL
jgi:hypothetical protein